MNRKNLILTVIAVFTLVSVRAQSNLLNAKTPSEIGVKTAEQEAANRDRPLPYAYVDDRDMMWSSVVWEYIDLNERLNLKYYYPIHENSTSESRKSLFSTLLSGIMKEEGEEGQITEVYDDTYFTTKLTKKEIEAKLFRIDTTDAGKDELNAGNTNIEEYITRTEINPGDIVGYKIKGVWYLDKRQGEMKFRLLGIAPVSPDVQTKGRSDIEVLDEKLALFWVWYPGARQVLYDMKVFNPENSSRPISFDHLLNAKHFNSNIYREENLYGNRDVSDYVKGNALFQVLESNRIKEAIRNKELDIWNY